MLGREARYSAVALAVLINERYGLSRRTLERFIRGRFNRPLQRYLDDLRLREAEMLAGLKQRTKDIANQLEFKGGPSQLCHQFKRYNGISLKVWRTAVETPAGASVNAGQQPVH